MAQLETLEAKMASIEVSLSSTPRRKRNGFTGISTLGSSIRSIPKELALKELESLKNALRDKENIIQNLKGQLNIPGIKLTTTKKVTGGCINTFNREFTENEKKQMEERLNKLKCDIDNKKLAIKNLKMMLEKLDVTDNIDVRIQQAELEYQLGREELNLLTLLEETRTIQLCLDESNRNSSDTYSLYKCVSGSGHHTLIGIEVDYDPTSPKFGAGLRDSLPGLWVDWALEETKLCKGDRVVEVNGKIVLYKSKDDLTRLLSAAPDPAQIVVLRKYPETSFNMYFNSADRDPLSFRNMLEVARDKTEKVQKTKEDLVSDNIRLTHRISYLEEQVSELLSRNKFEPESNRVPSRNSMVSTVETNRNVTNINITTQPVMSANSCNQNDFQVFQKGSHVTTLVGKIPGLETSKESHTTLPVRSKSSLSNVSNISNIHITANPQLEAYHCHRNHRHKHKSSLQSLQTTMMPTVEKSSGEKANSKRHNHHHHRSRDYGLDMNTAVEHVSRNNMKNVENGYKYSNDYKTSPEKNYVTENVMDQSFKKATKIVQELTRANKDPISYDKHRQRCLTACEKYNTDILKHYNARKSTSVVDFQSEQYLGSKYTDSKSVEELETSETCRDVNNRLHKGQDYRSVKSLDFDSDCNSVNTVSSNFYAKSVDYTSEPDNNRKLSQFSGYYNEHVKQRPTPPKKPLRLSLHKTQSLQSVEVPSIGPNSAAYKIESRKRNYRGETPQEGPLPNGFRCPSVKWSTMGYRKGVENCE